MISIDRFIETLRDSNNALLESYAEELTTLSKVPHNKKGLEALLNDSICEIYFKGEKNITHKVIACSNTTLIKMFALKRNSAYESNIDKLMSMGSTGLHSKSNSYVLSWNFLKNDYCKISTKLWRVGKFIRISPDNIKILNETLRDILNKDKGQE